MNSYSDYKYLLRQYNWTGDSDGNQNFDQNIDFTRPVPSHQINLISGSYNINYAIAAVKSDLIVKSFSSNDYEEVNFFTTNAVENQFIAQITAATDPNRYNVYFSDVAKVTFSSTSIAQANVTFAQINDTSGSFYHAADPSRTAGVSYDYSTTRTDDGISSNPDAYGATFFNKNLYTGWNTTGPAASASFWSILHEIGHALGLKHPMEPNPQALGNKSLLDNEQFSMMSYKLLFGMDYPNKTVFPSGLQLYDIAAIQGIYGRNYSTRFQDTVYNVSHGLGSTASAPFLYTIWDGGGIDTVDASAYQHGVNIDLRQGAFSSIGNAADPSFSGSRGVGYVDNNVAISFYAVIENAIGANGDNILVGNSWNNTITGGSGNDKIYGDGYWFDSTFGFKDSDPLHPFGTVDGLDKPSANNSGEDILHGGSGDDVIIGGAGFDTLYGDAGNDTLITCHMGSLDDRGRSSDRGGSDNGNDTVYGGTGNDVIYGGVSHMSPGDGIDFFDGGTVVLHGVASSSVNFGKYLGNIVAWFTSPDGSLTASILVDDTGAQYKSASFVFDNDSTINTNTSTITGSPPADIIARIDAFFGGTNGADTLNGSLGTDFLFGGIGNDTINGLGGDDLIRDDAGNDVVHGGPGSDYIIVGLGADVVYGDDGNDVISAGGVIGTPSGNVIESDADIIDGGAGDDDIGIGGYDTAYGGDGSDVISVSTNGSSDKLTTAYGGAGNDIIQLYNGGGNAYGDDGDDTIFTGGKSISKLCGGKGNDTFSVSSVGDVQTSGSCTYLYNLGDGRDTILYLPIGTHETIKFGSDIARGSVFLERSGDDLIVYINDNDNITVKNHFIGGSENQLEFLEYSDGYQQNVLTSTIIPYSPSQGNNTYNVTFASNQTISDAGGNDTLHIASTAFDQLTFSSIGSDLIISNGNNSITVAGQTGSDTSKYIETLVLDDGIRANLADYPNWHFVSANYNGDANNSVVTNDTIVDNSGSHTIHGYAGSDLIIGGAGNDTLYGDAGDDQIKGGDGNDTIYGGSGNDFLIGGASIDTLSYSDVSSGSVTVNLSLATAQNTGNAGTDTISGFENVTGTFNNDSLTGDSNDNVINGGSGWDTIQGLGGNDTLIGGSGNDTVSFADASSGVTFNLAITTAQVTGIGTYTVSGFEYITGSAFADTLTGDTNSNTIAAGAGNDMIIGGGGSDTIDGGSGDDTVSYTGYSEAVAVTATQTGFTVTHGAFTDTLTNVEHVIQPGSSSSGNDNYVVSFAGNQTLSDTGGVDTLRLTGSTFEQLSFAVSGNDLAISNGTNSVNISGEVGTDPNRVIETLTFDDGFIVNLAAFSTWTNTTANYNADATNAIDDMIIDNSAGHTIHAYSGNDVVVGSTGNDILYGEAGNDQLRGGDGNDTIYGGVDNDVLWGGAGVDTLSYSDVSAGSVIINLSVTGPQNTTSAGTDTIFGFENVTGTFNNDSLTGDSNDNVINGGSGWDTIQGLGGNDTLIGGSGTDTLSFADAGSGVSVNLGITTSQATGVGNDTISGFENLTGSGYNDNLTGDLNANVITGGSGNDIITGGGGADSLYGNAGADNFIFKAAALPTIVTVQDFRSGENDTLNVADLLIGYNSTTSSISDFVSFANNGANSVMSVDRDGSASNYTSQNVATIAGVTGLDAHDLLTQGHLIAA